MSILVTGTVAFDSVKTPFGEVAEALGGSATYFSTAASYFVGVKLCAVVGEDFPKEYINSFKKHNIDVDGLRTMAGETFRWKGYYDYDLNQAHTLETHLNVLSDFDPELPDHYKGTPFVFLANLDPDLQLKVLDQVEGPKLVACDTMNFWIENKKGPLLELLKRVDICVINEGEARELADEPNLSKAARIIMDGGPRTLIVKRGEYGAIMFTPNSVFSAPALPLEDIFDPTGAGDSFAGGFIGFLAKVGIVNDASLRKAIIFGSVMASFNVESFSLERLKSLSIKEIEERYLEFKELTHFESL